VPRSRGADTTRRRHAGDLVKVRVKPEQRRRFLEAIEVDALGSERDEPGCHRFNVLQDEQDENVYYFYEVYASQAALEAHRATPHYAVWRAAADALDGPTEAIRCRPVFPASPAYWDAAKAAP
jgi:autoinducer 2-degrading protein